MNGNNVKPWETGWRLGSSHLLPINKRVYFLMVEGNDGWTVEKEAYTLDEIRATISRDYEGYTCMITQSVMVGQGGEM